MDDPNYSSGLTLSGERAMSIWAQGKRAWNDWVKANPSANVDFSDAYFRPSIDHRPGAERIDFSSYKFPSGFKNFKGARFGAPNVDFRGAIFGAGDVDFSQCVFQEGHVDFSRCRFGQGQITFKRSDFGNSRIEFKRVDFGNGGVSFYDVNFGAKPSIFERVTFGTGDIDFSYARFGDGVVTFRKVDFCGGEVSFRNSVFSGPVRFFSLLGAGDCSVLSFEGATFEQQFVLTHEGRLGCPIDLRRTRMAHSVVLNDVHCDFVEKPAPDWTARLSQWLTGHPKADEPAWPWLKMAEDEEDSQRFRRLKEIAVSNRNHKKALEFHRQEMRARRGWDTNWLEDQLQFSYSFLSDYGRSIFKPFAALGVTLLTFASTFYIFRTEDSASFWTALTYSMSHLLAFIPSGRTARTQGEELLFGADSPTPEWAIGLGAFESIIAVILLFLLGLGLRNMFRV